MGRAHADWGEEVVACVVARDPARRSRLERELDALCLRQIARFKRPHAVVFTDALPRTAEGAVDREAVKVKWGAAP